MLLLQAKLCSTFGRRDDRALWPSARKSLDDVDNFHRRAASAASSTFMRSKRGLQMINTMGVFNFANRGSCAMRPARITNFVDRIHHQQVLHVSELFQHRRRVDLTLREGKLCCRT